MAYPLSLQGMPIEDINGIIDARGSAYYGTYDPIYIDTNYPLNTITLNDIRLLASPSGPSDLIQNGILHESNLYAGGISGFHGSNAMVH
jgi:hypothetical protein